MKMHTKILIYVGLTTVVILSILYLLSERMILNNYKKMEGDYSKEGMRRVMLSFFDEYNNLGALTMNYSARDETYRMLTQPKIPSAVTAYANRTYPDTFLDSMRLNAVLVFDQKSEVYWAKAFDFARNERLAYPADLIRALTAYNSFYIKHRDPDAHRLGIVVAKGYPYIVSSYPIVTSYKEGPVRGTLVFARRVDNEFVRWLSEKSDMTLEYSTLGDSFRLPGGASMLLLGQSWLRYWSAADTATITSYGMVGDINEKPALLLSFAQPRDFSIQAQENLRFYLAFFAVSGLSFFLLVSFVLKRIVFRRLNEAIEGMRYIDRQKEFHLRMKVTGNDEVTQLESTFNSMMTSLDLSQQAISYQANHDVMTGLANRKSFFGALEKHIAECPEGSRFAVLFIDLDHFKIVNDTMGHDAGDRLLKEAAKRIKACAGEERFVCRLGGDEFCIISEFYTEEGGVEELAGEIQKQLNQPFRLQGQNVSVSASIGISCYPDHGTDTESLLHRSDAAMLGTKEAGKAGHRWYSEEVESRRTRRLLLESALRTARKNDELQLHYQPKWNLESDRMTGVEALLRWNNPELGSVSPAEFIPIAESTGLINELGEWIMRTACRHYRSWQEQMQLQQEGWDGVSGKEQEFPLTVAVNTSGVQLLQPNFVERTMQIFREEGVDPSGFEFEVTESFAITNFNDVIDILTELQQCGFTVSIDDFGEGYSSMKYLCQLPIHLVKIDKSLIDPLTDNKRSRVIVSAIMDMAHRLGVTVVAEGVETQEQRRLLEKYDCDMIQGYLVSRPMPAEEFARSLVGGARV
ncbi:bifunctional diguanylate cyclase/phosphodiesterase [Paenibacillus gansuensis]|uniref:EAL domain-containing protein n=1 Tax=Paenibacillus gansuensis TaxID=306542 RepID=A0ABW5PHB4_9BACL